MKFDGEISTVTTVYDYNDRILKNKDGLPEKQFKNRESLLNVLFQNPHVKTIHHIFVSMFVGFIFITILRDYLDNNKTISVFRIIIEGFGKFPIALAGWIFLYFWMCTTHLGFKIWATVRTKFSSPKSTSRKLWDLTACSLLLGYYFFSFRFSAGIVTKFELPIASATFILTEQTRMLMKVHAFVRSNIPKVLKYKEKSDEKLVLPAFQHFIYFSMVPTLVYKDEYPRTSTIRWKVVALYALEFFGVILFYSTLMKRTWMPMNKDLGIRKITFTELYLRMLESSFPGLLFMLTSFYLVLHLVQNFFAEILRFGDRMFYKDWWTCTDFTTYYRTWNVVVYDWLHTYIYKDFYEIVWPGNKIFAKGATIFISAVVHEWILMHMLGFFFPLLGGVFFIFGALVPDLRAPKNSSLFNMVFWLRFSSGTGFLMSAYCMEVYARLNDVPPLIKDYDFYIPRSITCECYVYE